MSEKPDQERMDTVLEAIHTALEQRENAVRERLEAGLREAVAGAVRGMAEPPRLDPALFAPPPVAESDTSEETLATLYEAVDRIAHSDDQVAILNNLVEGGARFAGRVALFVVRNDKAMGWTGVGFAAADAEATADLRRLVLPLDSGSLLARAAADRTPVDGTDPEPARPIWSALAAEPSEAYVAMPLNARGRVAAMLFADAGVGSDRPIRRSALAILNRIAEVCLASLSSRPRGVERRPSATWASAQPGPSVSAPEIESETSAEPEPVDAPASPEPVAEATAAPQPSEPPTLEPISEPGENPAEEAVTPLELEPVAQETPEPTIELEPVAGETPDVEIELEPVAGETPDVEIELEPVAGEMPEPTIELEPAAGETPDAEIKLEPVAGEMPEPMTEPQPAAEMVPEPVLEPVAVGSSSSATAEQPAPSPAPRGVPQREPHEDARRYARLLVSEILLYNEAQVELGKKNRDLYRRLKDDLDRSEQMYRQRVSPEVAAEKDYFEEEIVSTLAGGDPALLGSR